MTKSVHFSLFHTWQVEKLDTVTGGPSVSPQLTHTMEISLRSHTRQVFLPSLSRTYGSSDWRRKSHQWTNQTDQWFPINSRVNRESNMNECPLFWPRVKNNRTYHSRAPCPVLLGCRIMAFSQFIYWPEFGQDLVLSGSAPILHMGVRPFRFLDFVLDLLWLYGLWFLMTSSVSIMMVF